MQQLFTFTSTSEAQTIAFANLLAPLLQAGDLVALVGDLGTGKSVTARAIVRALMHQPDLDVPSPTFTLVQAYEGPDLTVWHSDLYRLKDPEEVYDLGFDEALSHAVLLVEWPDRLPEDYQADCLLLTLKQTEDQTRRITLYGHDDWAVRLKGLVDNG